jgi:hypothetical protein
VSQRNPLNDRYQREDLGQTKKSAASLKPKTQAAASVHTVTKKKTRKEKKAARKEAEAKQNQLDNMFYNPPTPQYQRARKIWIILLGAAIACTCIGFAVSAISPSSPIVWIMAIPSYALIFIAIWWDFARVRKYRREYQQSLSKEDIKEAQKLAEAQAAAREKERAEKRNRRRSKKGQADADAEKADDKGDGKSTDAKGKDAEDSAKESGKTSGNGKRTKVKK